MTTECCYGAELYNPIFSALGMCNTYLGSKAYAYFGSSNTSYGDTTATARADMICQYFCKHLLSGTSAGSACLQAALNTRTEWEACPRQLT